MLLITFIKVLNSQCEIFAFSIVFPPEHTKWEENFSFWRTHGWQNRTKKRIATARKAKLCRHCENQHETETTHIQWWMSIEFVIRKTVINFFITIKLIKFQRHRSFMKNKEKFSLFSFFIYFYFSFRLDKIFFFSHSIKNEKCNY